MSNDLRMPLCYTTSLPEDRENLNLKISFNTQNPEYRKLNHHNGFGNAGSGMLGALKSLGYEVTINDHTADVGFVFNHPSNAMFFPHQYNILYFPWESTQVKPGWERVMGAVDELWTPSQWCADVFSKLTDTPIYVYEHGIGKEWAPKLRKRTDKTKFLNIGAEAARKNGWSVVRALRKGFPHHPDTSLTLKMLSQVSIPLPPSLGKVAYINERWTPGQLLKAYYDHHIYVYPSSGEGFGLTPLQAMATGMPTICVADWAPYADLLNPALTLHGKLVRSGWPGIHPGQVYRISEEDTVERMVYAYDNFERLAQEALEIAPKVHERYNWRTLTAAAFGGLKNRLS
jgi:glycosyltransferase involved in cell wall biosynthesis